MPRAKQPLDPAVELSIVDFVVERGGDVASSDIAEGVGIDKNSLRRYLPAMVEEGKLVSHGKKRWTRYFPGGTAIAPAPARKPAIGRVRPEKIDPAKSLAAEDYVGSVEGDAEESSRDPGSDKVDQAEAHADHPQEPSHLSHAPTSGIVAENPRDPLSVLRAALPHLEGEHAIDKFGKAVLSLVDNADVHELQIRRQVSILVRQGLVRARQVYDNGWRFYYSRA